jgi:hypothetical protein
LEMLRKRWALFLWTHYHLVIICCRMLCFDSMRCDAGKYDRNHLSVVFWISDTFFIKKIIEW